MTMPKRTDTNQPAIVAALRELGATVQDLHEVGRGCPDILVGWRGSNILMEIKTQSGRMTEDEHNWHTSWRGRVYVVKTVRQAIEILEDTNDE